MVQDVLDVVAQSSLTGLKVVVGKISFVVSAVQSIVLG
jgi:hypothetical protein